MNVLINTRASVFQPDALVLINVPVTQSLLNMSIGRRAVLIACGVLVLASLDLAVIQN